MTHKFNQPFVWRSLLAAWLLVPIGGLAWHYGPGRSYLARDLAGEAIGAGRRAAGENRYGDAAAQFAQAVAVLPDDDQSRRDRLLLEQARMRIQAGEMIAGQEQLSSLLQVLESRGELDGEMAISVRHELATSSYYAAWLMRLEGATAEEWMPEAERARQQFRLLAEQGKALNDARSESFQKNLEATIRLQQMDLSELMAKPLPKDCPSCCKNLSQRKRQQCQSRCKGAGKAEEEKPQDARQEIKKSRGAGLNATGGKGS